MDNELLKWNKEIKQLYIGYEDRNPTNKNLFKLAKRAIKKGNTSFKYIFDYNLEPITTKDFNWDNWQRLYAKKYSNYIINYNINYLNKKFNGYFNFLLDTNWKFNFTGFSSVYYELYITVTIYCNKINVQD